MLAGSINLQPVTNIGYILREPPAAKCNLLQHFVAVHHFLSDAENVIIRARAL